MDDKVVVTSMVNGEIYMTDPENRVRKVWAKKGTKIPLSKDYLREAIYRPGVEYLFRHGILGIEDMAFKIELGLEPEGAEAPTNIAMLDNKYIDRLLTKMPVVELTKELTKLSEEQKQELVNSASKMNNIELDRISVLDKACGTNLLKIIELNKLKEE